jgi:hypothetical protein
LGAITLRHTLNAKLLDGGGHVGYVRETWLGLTRRYWIELRQTS